MRAWLLTALLTVAASLVVVGVSLVSAAGAWIVAGVLLAGLSLLTLAESG
jgi:hypothetical protein